MSSNAQPQAPTRRTDQDAASADQDAARTDDDLAALYADARLTAFWAAYEYPDPFIRQALALAKSTMFRNGHYGVWEARVRALLQLVGVWAVVAVDRRLLSSPMTATFELLHCRSQKP
ncbi:hypothetical protein AMAG_20751 [Allomyces macrogynus ATCC 38327]|uniref:Uncharacterized protein n=1 Tax=Allomyces macrogynus (strain ATCC 38327) TaxID=578462 RepID=A0A0L0TFH7_ALLM3|nr:hypothetical protein AMAG_20751 [Allomyces macrogynus ATCC 38327]|eukprot:KNE73364.1 hypothetical protein AMAG_20751 [Allomyces macrogynus ATCC 38327]